MTSAIVGGSLEGAVGHRALAGGHVAYASLPSPKRTWNEDRAAVVSVGRRQGVLVVADGAGGHADADVVAQRALEAFAAALSESRGALVPRCQAAITAAHGAASMCDPDAGTTLTCVAISDDRFQSMHVGDTGVLLVGQRGARKFETVAHSPVGYALEAGTISEADALHHEHRHLVSNLLGFDDHHVETSASKTIAPRDTLLVASDGLLDNLHPDEIVEIARRGTTTEAVQNLVTRAHMRMGAPADGEPSKPDDLTVLLYRRDG